MSAIMKRLAAPFWPVSNILWALTMPVPVSRSSAQTLVSGTQVEESLTLSAASCVPRDVAPAPAQAEADDLPSFMGRVRG
jgi:hypothetical protein